MLIKYFIKGDQEHSTIHLRFSKGREFDFKRSTPYKINSKHWNSKKERVKNISGIFDKDEINNSLSSLKSHIESSFIKDYKSGVIISGDWLSDAINKFLGQQKDSDLNLFSEYTRHFIASLPNKKNSSKHGKVGVSPRTIEKYENVLNKISGFERYRKKRLLISDIDLKFERDFTSYLSEVEKLGDNTIGRMFGFIKTICNDARIFGVKVNLQLEKIRAYKLDVDIVVLDDDEIERIYHHQFEPYSYLDNARDWFILGLYTGQRVSDFLKFDRTIIKNNGFEFFQEKTNANMVVPMHPFLLNIFDKHDGGFPRKISDQKFNIYIKEVCKEVGINESIQGRKINPKTKRKESGVFPKYELVTSHICRRSFATNLYGKVPTPALMNTTGHTTETAFLKYIRKTPRDSANQLMEYWVKQIALNNS